MFYNCLSVLIRTFIHNSLDTRISHRIRIRMAIVSIDRHKLSENGAGGSGGRLYNVCNTSFNLDTEYLERSNVLSSAQTAAQAKTAQGQVGKFHVVVVVVVVT